jgi:hypothetical protein
MCACPPHVCVGATTESARRRRADGMHRPGGVTCAHHRRQPTNTGVFRCEQKQDNGSSGGQRPANCSGADSSVSSAGDRSAGRRIRSEYWYPARGANHSLTHKRVGLHGLTDDMPDRCCTRRIRFKRPESPSCMRSSLSRTRQGRLAATLGLYARRRPGDGVGRKSIKCLFNKQLRMSSG